jgi:hypothetical protein
MKELAICNIKQFKTDFNDIKIKSQIIPNTLEELDLTKQFIYNVFKTVK